MTLAKAAELIAEARQKGSAVPAFNVITLEQAEAVVCGAVTARSSVLIQVSENAILFRGGYAPLLAACRELALAAAVPIGLHLDHISDETLAVSLIADAEKLGIGSIMFDASMRDFDENWVTTRTIADRAHARDLWVEAELGAIGGKGGAHTPGVRTDPEEAALYVERTHVDGLAVAVGSQHAMTTQTAVLDLGLIERIARRVPVPLVLHGSSGVDADTLRCAIGAGICKVNIGTMLTTVWTRSLRTELERHADANDPRAYTRVPRTDVSEIVDELCELMAEPREAASA